MKTGLRNKRAAKPAKRQRQKGSQAEALRKFLSQFKTNLFKKGDLVLTAEVHRVVDPEWGTLNGNRYSGKISVVTVYPRCEACHAARVPCDHQRIMEIDAPGGQQAVMGFV